MAENNAPETDNENAAPLKKPTVNPGLEIARKITPVGCVALLGLLVLYLVYCFSSGSGDPLPGYTAPHDAVYYSQSVETLTELKTELEADVFPKLGSIESCTVKDGKLEITIPRANYNELRNGVLRHYDGTLFTFVVGS